MKLPFALGIILTSARPGAAFAPSLPVQRQHGVAAPHRGRLSMVGGGMIDQPPGDDSPGSSSDDEEGDDEASFSSPTKDAATLDPEKLFAEEKEKFLAKIGNPNLTIDPWDPNPYIKPRPGKYGWADKNDDQNLFAAKERAATPSDEEIAQRGQFLSDAEREENLTTIRDLRQNVVPELTRQGRSLEAIEGAADANEREMKDPWFRLNERLGDAIKYGTDDPDTLRTLMTKVGGPPPQLIPLADHPRGYVLRTEVIGMALSNERLERLIDRRTATDDAVREERRREAARNDLAKLDNPAKEEAERAELAEIRRQRKENWLRNVLAVESRSADDYEESDEAEKKEYDDKRQELLKRWEKEATEEDKQNLGADGLPEYFTMSNDFVNQTMKGFVTDLKRMNSMFEDDDEEEGLVLGEDGTPAEADAGAEEPGRPASKAAQARAEALRSDGSGRPRLPGDADVTRGELDPDLVVNEASAATSGPLTVEVSSTYNAENSDPPLRKHCFQYKVRIANDSPDRTVQLLSRRFEIQTVGSSTKDVVQGEGVTGRQPVLGPGEAFEYTSTAPLSVRPLGTTDIAARMSGEYRYCTLEEGQETATDEQVNKGQGEAGAELKAFHFVFPEEQRVKPVRPSEDDEDDEDEDDGDDVVKTTTVASSSAARPSPPDAKDATTTASSSSTPASSLPGEPDMTSGNISSNSPNDASDTLTHDVRVVVTSTYRPERSDAKLDKHCFAYNVRITNESKTSIQLVSRRFEIQTVGSANKDVVQGPGVTGRQPVLKPGESFEYTSTAPLSVKPMMDKTKVVARMSGEYNFVQLAEDGKTPLGSTPLKAELGAFHFILPSSV